MHMAAMKKDMKRQQEELDGLKKRMKAKSKIKGKAGAR